MLKVMLERVLIIGSGMTGASVASLIRQDLNRSATISVWDKSKGIGGRMSTSRCNSDSRCTVDLGAQYISATPEYQQRHASHYNELTEKGVLQRLSLDIEGHQDKVPGTKHYVTPDGVSTLVKHYLNKADPVLGKGHLVKDISIADSKVKVTRDEGHSEVFDAVVVTMPVPQILQLQGDIVSLIDKTGVRQALQSVSYSSRFAVGLFYKPGTILDIPWSAKYITDNPCIRFVSVDNKKRGKETLDVGPSICVHTGAPWGLKNVEMDKDAAAVEILEHLKAVLPGLPEPVEVKGHKWRYSQVHKSYPGNPGCIVLSEKPAVILAGDAFMHSNFDGCLESAVSVHQTLTKLVRSKV